MASEHERESAQEVSPGGPAVLYPDQYLWFTLLSALDVMLTWYVLQMGGREANPLAEVVLQIGGLNGLIVLKFGVLVLVVLICEFIGRRRWDLGRRLVHWAIAINCIPVAAALLQIAIVTAADAWKFV